MKRFFYLLLFVSLFTSQWVNAVPASPYPVQYRQPDGSVITILLKGDEWVHWATSTDGFTLLVNKTGFYEYAKKGVSGELNLSGILVHDLQKRTPEEIHFLKTTLKDLRYSREQINLFKQLRQTREKALKTHANLLKNNQKKSTSISGVVRAPLILVQFPGKLFKKSQDDFDLLMNQVNYTAGGTITGSVHDYFYDNSYGQLEFQVDVFGPYTLAYNISYYDFNSGGDPAIMAREAALAATADGCNFANYDSDDDGFVDGLHLIFAGYGQEAGAPAGDAIWSHSYITYKENYDYLIINDKIVYHYSCSPELRNTSGTNITYIGVIAHELSHVFGLPDFYDTNYENQGQALDMGEWDIMARGSWNDEGRTPANHTAWSKNYLGWVPVVELTSEADITLPNPAEEGAAYRINTTTSNEYFLVENRQKQGWDAYIPAGGMIVYHVDENYWGWGDNCVNCVPSHRGLYVKQAEGGRNSDNSDRSTDPYPSGENQSFTDWSVPDSKSWAGNMTDKPVTKITHNTTNKTVSFKFMENPDYYDAALSRFVGLPLVDYNTGNRNIQVELENQGKILTEATISWSMDGQPHAPYHWTGSLAYGKKETLTIGTSDLAIGTHTLSATVTVDGDTEVANNTITFTIEIKDQETLPYATEFNGSLAGWESVDMVGGIDWTWSNKPYYTEEYAYMDINTTTRSNGYAIYGLIQDGDYLGPNPAQAALVSPAFNFSNIENAIDLFFEFTARGYFEPTILKVQVSTDNFTTQIKDIWSQTMNEWMSASASPMLDLTAFAGQSNVRIRFLYTGGLAFAWAVDDIKLSINKEPRLKSLSVSSGELSPAFSAIVGNYTVKVDNSVSSIELNAVAVRSTDVVTGTGTKVLNEGDNIFPITVATSDGSTQKVYTVVVKRRGQALSVPFTEGFESGAALWVLENGMQVNQWAIGTATAESGSHSAYISNDGGLSNSYTTDNNSLVYLFSDVFFTPPADASHVYQLSFDWKLEGESCCDRLQVILTDIDTNPVAGESLYNAIYLGDFINAPTWQKAEINFPKEYGYAQSGETKRLVFGWYNDSSVGTQPPIAIDNVSIRSIDPNEALLNNLTVSAGVLSPSFYPEIFNYTVTVPNEISSITINATTARPIDNIVSGTGAQSLEVGENPFEVIVSNPDGSIQKTYQVVVIRQGLLFEAPFTEDFESITEKWTLVNGTQTNHWFIGTATAASGVHSAYISNDGGLTNHYAPVNGTNFVYLFCDVYFPPNYTSGRYQLSFDWKGADEWWSSNEIRVYLADMDVYPVAGEWMNDWYSDIIGIFYHSTTWKREVIDISWYVYWGVTKRLVFCWRNEDGIEVVAPAIDNIAVTLTDPTDATLRSLSVDGGVLSPEFEPNIFTYTMNVAKNVSRTRIDAIPSQENATVIGANEEVDLEIGSNVFHLLVLAENMNYRNTYTVQIIRDNGTGINNPDASTVNLYPNPTSGIIHVENVGDKEIAVYNLWGELLLRTHQNPINLSDYPKGVYILQIGSQNIKVIKQ